MVHRFNFHHSTVGLDGLSLERLFLPPAGFEIANDLFRSGGIAIGTLRYTDPPTGAEVTEATWLNAMGLAGTGAPVGVPALAPGVPDTGFVGLLNGGAFGYFVLDGLNAPVLTWDDTAEGTTRDAALADFAANAAAARADYQAQLDAVLAQVVADRYGYTFGGTVMEYRPSDGTALTYGDFFSTTFFPGDGFYALGPFGNQGFGTVFAPDEAADLRLTRADDVLEGEAFSAGTLTIDMGRGDDQAELFHQGNGAVPALVVVEGGSGDDALTLGAVCDTELDGGRGRDVIDLTWGTASGAGTTHRLSGGKGQDELVGAKAGVNIMDGGVGRDLLVGGTAEDTLTGGEGNDILFGGAGGDTFTFGPASGRDTIGDFAAGDLIRIDASYWAGSVADFIADRAGVDAFGDILLRLSGTDTIRLSAGDFDLTDVSAAVGFV